MMIYLSRYSCFYIARTYINERPYSTAPFADKKDALHELYLMTGIVPFDDRVIERDYRPQLKGQHA